MELEKLVWDAKKIPVSELIPNANNPRTITKAKLKSLEESINTYGIFKPIICDYDLSILGGTQRQRVLLEMFPSDYLVLVSIPNRPLTEGERQAVILLDNGHYGEWDMDALANGFNFEMIKELNLDIVIPNVLDEGELDDGDDDDSPSLADELNKKWLLEIQLPNEMELRDIYDEMISRGYIVKEK